MEKDSLLTEYAYGRISREKYLRESEKKFHPTTKASILKSIFLFLIGLITPFLFRTTN